MWCTDYLQLVVSEYTSYSGMLSRSLLVCVCMCLCIGLRACCPWRGPSTKRGSFQRVHSTTLNAPGHADIVCVLYDVLGCGTQASYLSPNVSIATSVERATQVYGVSFLVARSVVELCPVDVVSKGRLIDRVVITGAAPPPPEAQAAYVFAKSRASWGS